jgi:uncharacterized protein YueI
MNDRSELEEIIARGIQGDPELKKDERRKYLGEFRERILKALTFEQIDEPGTYPEIKEAIQDPRAHKLVINQKANLNEAREYIQLARKKGLQFTMVDNPEYAGNIGLVVVSDKAVDVKDIMVK